jgi:Zn-dependent protease with chaperone function
MGPVLLWVAIAWCVWAAFNLCIVLMSERRTLAMATGAHVVGIWRYRIVVPEEVIEKLTLVEYSAVWMHERGHIHHQHIRKNLVRAVLFPFGRSRARAESQELEADAYAVQMGYGPHLASALRKLSRHPFDLLRAQMLDRV